ncbi:hypothetical protein VC83_02768 [Pseudogymnoascus destructans]|nr:uncharacterized protein VC83_02768 [Pseudogymnoascus destructans]OAF60260.2 hypothetical protein VC83_02768 [Pseudogymnoascus destructans]
MSTNFSHLKETPRSPIPAVMAGAAFQGLEWAATTFGLEPTWTLEPDLEAAKQIVKSVDRIVSMHFFWGDHIHQDVSRGPFSSTRNWMDARLALSEHDCRSTLTKYSDRNGIDTDDEDALDDAQRTLNIVNRLKALVGQIFSIGHLEDEPSMLFHDDLSQHNILVDDGGALTGVLDWECVSIGIT